MPIIYSSATGTSDDGYISITGQSSWAGARDSAAGVGTNDGGSASSNFTSVSRGAARGGGYSYGVTRSFVVFDTSGITGTVASATLSIRGFGYNTGSVIAVKSTAYGGDGGTSLAVGDFDAISGWSSGSSLAGSATVYGAQILTSSWSTSSYNDFTATSDLLTDMKNNSVVIICFMDYTNDYLNTTPLSNATWRCGGYYAESSVDPKIDYTLATGYGHEVNNVGATKIAKVKGVATANIAKVNSVD